MRVRIVKSDSKYKEGDVIEVSKNVAFGLIDSGVGVVSKDMIPDDYKQAGEKEDGKPIIVRTHKRK